MVVPVSVRRARLVRRGSSFIRMREFQRAEMRHQDEMQRRRLEFLDEEIRRLERITELRDKTKEVKR